MNNKRLFAKIGYDGLVIIQNRTWASILKYKLRAKEKRVLEN